MIIIFEAYLFYQTREEKWSGATSDKLNDSIELNFRFKSPKLRNFKPAKLLQWKNQALLLGSATAGRLEKNAFEKIVAAPDCLSDTSAVESPFSLLFECHDSWALIHLSQKRWDTGKALETGDKTCRISAPHAFTIQGSNLPMVPPLANASRLDIFVDLCRSLYFERSSREWAKSRWMFTTSRWKSWRRRTTAATGKEDSRIETGWLTCRDFKFANFSFFKVSIWEINIDFRIFFFRKTEIMEGKNCQQIVKT